MDRFEMVNISVEPGELKFGSLPVGEMRDGSIASVPLMVMHGTEDGPKLWIDSAIHGDEIAGIEVIRRILREEVDPKQLRGTIVAVPVHNPYAYQAGAGTSHYYLGKSPEAPGNPNGSLLDRLSHKVFSMAKQCDHVLHLHSNYYPAVEFSLVAVSEDRAIVDASLALAEALGLPIQRGEGLFSLMAQRAGKPTVVVELLAQGYIDKRAVDLGVLGVLNVLRYLKMIPGEVKPLPGLKVPLGRYGRSFVVSNRGGLVHFRKGPGDRVEADEVIAIIRNVFGDIVEEVHAPTDGYIRTVLYGQHNEAVFEGTVIASIFAAEPGRDYFHE